MCARQLCLGSVPRRGKDRFPRPQVLGAWIESLVGQSQYSIYCGAVKRQKQAVCPQVIHPQKTPGQVRILWPALRGITGACRREWIARSLLWPRLVILPGVWYTTGDAIVP